MKFEFVTKVLTSVFGFSLVTIMLTSVNSQAITDLHVTKKSRVISGASSSKSATASPFISAPQSIATSPPELTLMVYDSLVAKGGLGPEIFPLFEKKCACRVKVLPSGDGGQLLSRLELDATRGTPSAQIVLGLDQHTFQQAKKWIEPWGSWRPKGWSQLKKEVKVFSPENGFLPFDYGVFALMSDQVALKEMNLTAPKNLRELLEARYRRNIILEDPRTSTPGLAFLLFTEKIFGKDTWAFWNQFKTQWLTLTPGWDGAYGLFLKKEAPLVWSYTSSEAYHREHGDNQAHSGGRYKAIVFEEGAPIQIEGAALVRGAFKDQAELARARLFLEFLISPEVQAKIPQKNWMLPTIKNVVLPQSFKNLPTPKKIFSTISTEHQVKDILQKWNETVSRVGQ